MLKIANPTEQDEVGEAHVFAIEEEVDEDQVVNMDEYPVGEGECDEREKNIINDNEGLIVVSEDNIVSEEDSFTESDEDANTDASVEAFIPNMEEEAIIADIDDSPKLMDTPVHSRPRRANVGAGVE